MRLIDADALHDWLKRYARHGSDDHLRQNARDLMKHVDEQPTLRCDNCEHYEDNVYCPRKGESYWAIRFDAFSCCYWDARAEE